MDFYLSKVSLKELPNNREKMIFFIAVFVFSFVFLKSCWYPSFEAMGDVKKEYAQIREDYEGLKGGPGQGESASEWGGDPVTAAKYADWASSIAESGADTAIVREFSNPSFLRDVQLKGISFIEGPKLDGIMTRGFKVSLYGPFSSVGSCLMRVNQIPLLATVNAVLLASVPNEEGRVNLDMEGVVYGWK